jgi:hypothetical protein
VVKPPKVETFDDEDVEEPVKPVKKAAAPKPAPVFEEDVDAEDDIDSWS